MEVHIRKARRGDEPEIWRLHTRATMDGRNFYRACGFTERGVRTATGRRTGVTFEEHLMDKVLQSPSLGDDDHAALLSG
jgi:hypothetical protein